MMKNNEYLEFSSEITKLKEEKKQTEIELDIDKNKYADLIKNQLGFEIKKSFNSKPIKVSKIKLLFDKLFRII